MTGRQVHLARWAEVLAVLEPIDLGALTAAVEDTEALGRGRFDRKYLIDVDRIDQLASALGQRWRVLDVDGRRITPYTTRYFDTADLVTFRHHRQGRRRRFKVRIRRYGDAPDAVLEVKYRGRLDRTIKARTAYPASHDGLLDGLDDTAMRFVTDTLRDAYEIDAPERLRPSLTTAYGRTTFVDVIAGERLTVDLGLVVSAGAPARPVAPVELGTRFAIVETKSGSARTSLHHRLRALGARPERVSKYCLGIGAVRPDIAINPWGRTLDRLTAA